MSTDHNEAMRLAEILKEGSRQFNDDAAALLLKLAARITELESHVHTCGPTCSKAGCINRRITAERDQLRAELETERMRLAACGVVAMSNTSESAAKARDMHPDYLCASVRDVAAAVDREMALRAEVERLRADEERIDYLECEANELRTRETGEDDYEWVVRSNQMDQPYERDVGSGKTIREAIDAARTQKDEG